ncbi:uncharacterized protein LOC123708650 [Pieris brassicae]|uniref:Uncharacterized protein n=1 Tax=Pieris brassicae TaxID=7116 RepID=A0A9P0SSG6_PIEBR|nr:uncharacterized protein LOC123708650 [Pieris brassicae]XP_045515421.1 uncharacterized protein LOC123708650 [Pieris brassicae]CAH3899952.1 unnamed protein product [Pieris brassicae]
MNDNESWTSKDALYRDLARAQGGAPIAITDPLLYHETPTREYDEEKDLEYQFRDASATTDFSEGPDLQMIMQMLEMVNDYDVTADSKPVEIRQLNPLSKVFVPKSSGDASDISEQKSTAKKKNRNAAIESIIKAQEASSNLSETSKYKPIPLTNKLNTENIKQNITTEKKQNGLKPIVYNSSMASSMFKKKTVSNKLNKSPDTSKVSLEILKTNTFVPSKVASSYYEKFVEFNEAKEEKRDIWTLVQKKIKESEERKRREAELATSSGTEKSGEASSPPLVQESSNEEQGR